MISETALREFKELWSEEFSEEISDEQATELGINLLTIFDKVYRPVKKDWLQAVSEERDKIINKTNITQNEPRETKNN
jgi:hypothetical protein